MGTCPAISSLAPNGRVDQRHGSDPWAVPTSGLSAVPSENLRPPGTGSCQRTSPAAEECFSDQIRQAIVGFGSHFRAEKMTRPFDLRATLAMIVPTFLAFAQSPSANPETAAARTQDPEHAEQDFEHEDPGVSMESSLLAPHQAAKDLA